MFTFSTEQRKKISQSRFTIKTEIMKVVEGFRVEKGDLLPLKEPNDTTILLCYIHYHF